MESFGFRRLRSFSTFTFCSNSAKYNGRRTGKYKGVALLASSCAGARFFRFETREDNSLHVTCTPPESPSPARVKKHMPCPSPARDRKIMFFRVETPENNSLHVTCTPPESPSPARARVKKHTPCPSPARAREKTPLPGPARPTGRSGPGLSGKPEPVQCSNLCCQSARNARKWGNTCKSDVFTFYGIV